MGMTRKIKEQMGLPRFNPLDWIHQWDNYEMMMYAEEESGEPAGIFMQVSRRSSYPGAEQWEVLYQRKLADISMQTESIPGSELWQEQVLRDYLQRFPTLVVDEKEYVQNWFSSSGLMTDKEKGDANT
ncbi:hypothetical protein D2Q93_01905 [Alicyclobacillaceae bacterium I2511]|nr:hypothetical protein D2Q93_01905 [Alicyclobacillaceae bacterium I2511]